MTWIAPEVDRDRAPVVADERSMLDAWLDFHRQTLLSKCTGLTAEQLRTASVEPSNMTLLGLVRHSAENERWWFRQQFAGLDLPYLYYTQEQRDRDFEDVAAADPEADLAIFHEEIELVRQTVAGRSLDETFVGTKGRDISLRWVYLHMIEEYARHNGHADLIRERIDGTTGE
ncbi:DinB family protein [Plantactinospora sp. S1510]|uniref:DinB family protein n=1 Tax=Plantactinospora alkalitolerans TaxID=2789879 RepID=A0ABS0H5Q3_9ACTN|nr:DinB family protein [Plantactinospora alkalitolerans]MBF9133792.1 DinB family protein [Plantactinospora alkalitolerans]